MSQKLPYQHKRSSVANRAPVAADLQVGETAINFVDKKIFTKDASNNIVTLSEPGIIYNREVHVATEEGNDTTGNGSYQLPFKTITHALSTMASGERLIIHTGSYSENVTVTNLNLDIIGISGGGGSVNLSGAWTYNVASGSCRIEGVNHSGTVALTNAGGYYFRKSLMTGGVTKSGSGYVELRDVDAQSATGQFSVTGAGIVACQGGKQSGIVINNANAFVNISNGENCLLTTVTSGTFIALNSYLFATTATGNAVTAAAAGVCYFQNSRILGSTQLPGRVAISGFSSFLDTTYDKANSTTGTNLSTTSYSDIINVISAVAGTATIGGNLTLGNVTPNSAIKLYSTANRTITIYPGNTVSANYSLVLPNAVASSNGQVLTSNTDGTLSWATAASSYGNSNVELYLTDYLPNYAGELSGVGTNISNIQGSSIVGNVENANIAAWAEVADEANSVALANVVGIGNIASIDLEGSNTVALLGDGTWGTISGGSLGNVGNANFNGNTSTWLDGNGGWTVPPGTYGDTNVGSYMANYSGNLGNVGNLTVTGALSLGNVSNIPVANSSNAYYGAVIDSTGKLVKEPTVASLSPVNDNTLTTPPTSPAVDDAYLVPATGATGAWLNHGNEIATWDGSAWVFYTPTNGDTTSVLTGTNAGKTYTYNGTAWAVNTSPTYSGLPLYNYVNTSAYTTGTIVVYNNTLYQATKSVTANSWSNNKANFKYVAVGQITDGTANATVIAYTNQNSGNLMFNANTNIVLEGANSSIIGTGANNKISIGRDANSNAQLWVGANANSNASLYVNGSKLEGVTYSGSYIQAVRNTNQSYTNSTATDVIFNSTVSSSGDIALNTSTGVFTLRANRTYKLSASVNFTGVTTNAYALHEWQTTGGVALASSTGQYALPTTYSLGNGQVSMTENTVIYRPTVDTDVKLRFSPTDTGTGNILSGTRATIEEVGAGRAYYFTDYSSVSRSSNQTYTAGQLFDLVFDSIQGSSGGLTYNNTTGVFTLKAGKTYLLKTALWFQGSAAVSQLIVQWVDNTNTALSTNSGLSLLPVTYSNLNRSALSASEQMYTATVDTQVKLRVVTNTDAGSGSILQYSWATITQVGGSSITGNVTIGGGGTSSINGVLSIKDTSGSDTTVGYKKSQQVAYDAVVTVDNINIKIPSTGNKAIMWSTVSGTAAVDYSSMVINSATPASSFNGGVTMSTTYQYPHSVNLTNVGAIQEVWLNDTTNNRAYRITLLFSNATTKNLITIERLV